MSLKQMQCWRAMGEPDQTVPRTASCQRLDSYVILAETNAEDNQISITYKRSKVLAGKCMKSTKLKKNKNKKTKKKYIYVILCMNIF